MTVSSDLEDDEVELCEDTEAKCALNCHSFCDEQEWRLHKSINIWKKTAGSTHPDHRPSQPNDLRGCQGIQATRLLHVEHLLSHGMTRVIKAE